MFMLQDNHVSIQNQSIPNYAYATYYMLTPKGLRKIQNI